MMLGQRLAVFKQLGKNFVQTALGSLQLLPFCPGEIIDKVEHNVQKLRPVTTMLAEGMTPEEILAVALDGMEFDVLDTYDTAYRCTCSRRKVEGTLLALPKQELLDLPDDSGKVQVTCRFCDKVYGFTRDDVAMLAARGEE